LRVTGGRQRLHLLRVLRTLMEDVRRRWGWDQGPSTAHHSLVLLERLAILVREEGAQLRHQATAQTGASWSAG
jgi:hypothetical protein